jgi:hypothetical protein
MTNKALMSIIAVLLLGMISVGLIHALDDRDESTFDRIGNSVEEIGEEVRDEIDDHTDDR